MGTESNYISAYISTLHAGRIISLPENDFLKKYSLPMYLSYGNNKEEAEANFVRDWFGLAITRGVKDVFVGHCRKCGEPITGGGYARFVPTEYKVAAPMRHWYLHQICYEDLVQGGELSSSIVKELKDNKPVFRMHKMPNMVFVCCRKGIRTYKNHQNTLYVKRDIKSDVTNYQITKDLPYAQIKELYSIIVKIENERVIL